MKPRYITPEDRAPEPIWDRVEFEVFGSTRDVMSRRADEALAMLAGGAEYRFDLTIRGNGMVSVDDLTPANWTAEVSGSIKRM
jgi:hypothetical protein